MSGACISRDSWILPALGQSYNVKTCLIRNHVHVVPFNVCKIQSSKTPGERSVAVLKLQGASSRFQIVTNNEL